ncbi:MAG TPA: lamin tail domain-containing protein [Anaerolineales bacterium]|nr:lamin tail domain-containing protein [Anaerolineales bacterium]
MSLSLLAASPRSLPHDESSTTPPGDTPATASDPPSTLLPSPPIDTGTPSLDPASATPAQPTATLTPASTLTIVPTSTETATESPSPLAFTPTSAPSLETGTPETTASTDTASPTAEPQSTDTPSPSVGTFTPSPSPTGHASTETPMETPSPTDTPHPSLEPSSTPTAASSTPTSAATDAPTYPAGAVLINEVGWSGTEASASDEWLELWNPGAEPISLDGWRLTDGNDVDRNLTGSIAGYGFYLLERTDDSTISDIPADYIYTGSLNNSGESLRLHDPSGEIIDTANASGGPWPAGGTSPRASMERHGALDLPANWGTFTGAFSTGTDADGNPVFGTPRHPNSPSSSTSSPTPSLTPSPPPSPPSPYPEGAVLINEVAWAGTLAFSSDEWIELLNPGSQSVSLEGWRLTDGDDIDITLQGSIAGRSYFLLERSDDSTVADIAADQTYSGSLSNSGEALFLIDPTGAEIDSANGDGGRWPAGSVSTRSSMERGAGPWWGTFSGFYGVGRDAAGHPIRGTPRAANSILSPTPTPTWIPGQVVINEVLVRPHYDWEGAGGVTTDDEFIELYNRGPHRVNLRGWILDDYVVGGSSPYVLPSISLDPGEYAVLFRTRTHIALNDDGDQIRLSAPDGRPIDKIRYLRIRAYNLSYGRLPDGDDVLVYGLWPTPGDANVLFVEPTPTAVPTPLVCPQPRLPRRAALLPRPEPCP